LETNELVEQMSFKKNNYIVVKDAISKELANFLYIYFQNKKNAVAYMLDKKYISPFEKDHGHFQDSFIPNSFSRYADPAFETLLMGLKNKIEKNTKLKLNETYSYARLYKKGDELVRHKDRYSCEVSVTLNLGGDPWPIFIEPDSSKGKLDPVNRKYISANTKGVSVSLEPGDIMIYKGIDCEHWREPFNGDICGQVFLHYNDVKTRLADFNKYDTRPGLCLPEWFKKTQLP
jgi:hypothetical protein